MPEPALPARLRRVRPVVTGRALVIGAVVILLVVLLASPLHRFLGSRSDIGAARQQLAADKRQLAELRAEQAKWDDPGYIQRQARARLQFAMPGDTVYAVVDRGAKTRIEQTSGQGGDEAARSLTWNGRLWQSVVAASK